MTAEPFNRDKAISDLFRSPDLAAAIGKMEPAPLRDDLRQELFLVLCEMDATKLQGLSERGELRWWAVRTMMTMICTNRSTFYITHRRFNADLLNSALFISPEGLVTAARSESNSAEAYGVYHNSEQATHHSDRAQPEGLIHHDLLEPGLNWLERVDAAVAELDPYEANMIRLYADMGNNCQPLAEATGIQVRSVRYVVTQAKVKLQKKLRACS